MTTAIQIRSTFRQSCSVRCEIRATPEKIWGLLTDAPRFPAWSSTVTKCGATGSPMFRGVRMFTLAPKSGGVTELAMTEVFAGAMLPMIRGSLPDFGPAFETFANDLKAAAER